MARTPVKKLGKVAAAIHAKKINGMERVTFPETELCDLESLKCLNWYSSVQTPAHAKDYVIEWMKQTNDCRLPMFTKTPEVWVRTTAGWIARMMTLGANLSDRAIETFHRLVNESIRVKPFEGPEEAITAPVKPTVRERVVSKAGEIIADVEDALDHWRTQPFSLYTYLNGHKVAPLLVKAVIDYYSPLVTELTAAGLGKDKDIKEAYSHLSKMELRRYTFFVTSIVTDAERYVQQTRAAKPRKVREKKEIPLDKKLSLLQYMVEYKPNQLKSVAPEKMIGASEVWLYETVAKRVTVLRADNPKGIDLHRTTLVGFDPSKSAGKRIGRKTSQTLDSILRGTKLTLKRIFDEINADSLEATGRVNANTIILKVIP